MPSSNTPDIRLVKIARTLLSLTRSGAVQWESRAFSDREQFDYSTVDTTVSVYSVDNDNNYPFVMVIRNEQGFELDFIRSAGHQEELDNHSDLLHDLYFAARRNALQIDAAIDRLAERLGIDEDPPF